MSREALYVGIDQYLHRPVLRSCASDARAVADLLAENAAGSPVGGPNWTPASHAVLSSADGQVVDGAALQRVISRALRKASKGDFLFYFAGHGVKTDKGLLLASFEDDPDGQRCGVYVKDLLEEIEKRSVNSATIILDCCHAGLAAEETFGMDVSLLASTGADDEAREPELTGHSAFTELMLLGLRGQAADAMGQVTTMSLFSYVAGVMDLRLDGQSPVFAGKVASAPALRWADGKVSLEDLKRLIKPPYVNSRGVWVPGQAAMFPTATARFQVEPDHEAPYGADRTADWKVEELNPKQREMEYLKRLRNAGLLIAEVGGAPQDLYFAVKKSGHVRLTAQGQFFWRAVSDDRLRFS